ncbi:NAD(P)-dependent oxidoreductase [Ramlibacter sp. GTP1]|uniref:NAD(P)-dependent oxidoreductase n=2 Tax=Ramlibacter albus TaxID=2079448 RepID=A0A923S2M9_9BURK|nr:NAD(P)-dependent oxidoreductase [Ramlibacter albus]
MGGAMAAHLLEQGWAVRVRDIDAAKMAALARQGAVACASASEAVQGCSAVIVCVVDAQQSREVLFGERGAAGELKLGQDVLLCPTISPGDVESIADELLRSGVSTLDAPMSGGPARARDGSMSLMVACDDTAYERQRALLEALSRNTFRVGTRPGDGARTKLVNNLLAGINLAGAAEVMALAQRMGLNLGRTLDVIERSSGQSWIGSDRMRRAIAGDYAPRAHVTLLAKDTRLAMEAARDAGFEGSLGTVARDTFAKALQEGLADLDDAALFKLFSRDVD